MASVSGLIGDDVRRHKLAQISMNNAILKFT